MRNTSSIIAQLLRILPRYEFDRIASLHKGARRHRTCSRWDQFLSLLCIQLKGYNSLRAATLGLQASSAALRTAGAKPIPRSTLADANKNRPCGFYEDIFALLLRKACSLLGPKNAQLPEKLFSLDASVVNLCLSLFPWADYRSGKGGIKLHVLFDCEREIPVFLDITKARSHEINKARELDLPPGSTVVFDRGYVDYDWYASLGANSVSFVTRIKKNARAKLVERCQTDKDSGVTSDHIVELDTGDGSLRLRRIGYRDEKTRKHYLFLSNRFDLPARTIADIYKKRWQIEIFFRFIKQSLKVKRFVGRSENAVRSQLFVAMIACLLLAWIKQISRSEICPQGIILLVRDNLFRICDVNKLLAPPTHRQVVKDLKYLWLTLA